MADVPPPNLDDRSSTWFRRVLGLFGRGVVYSLAFWLVYAGVYRAPWSTPASSASADETNRQTQAWKAYDEQQRRTLAQMEASEAYLKRMDALVTTQEKLMVRFEKVIESWERTAPSKR